MQNTREVCTLITSMMMTTTWTNMLDDFYTGFSRQNIYMRVHTCTYTILISLPSMCPVAVRKYICYLNFFLSQVRSYKTLASFISSQVSLWKLTIVTLIYRFVLPSYLQQPINYLKTLFHRLIWFIDFFNLNYSY